MAPAPIALRRTATAGNIPNPDMLTFGELVLNIQDGALFFKSANGTGVHQVGNTAAPPSFGVVIANGSTLTSSVGNDTLRLHPGRNVTINADVVGDNVVFSLPDTVDLDGYLLSNGVQILQTALPTPASDSISIGVSKIFGSNYGIKTKDPLGQTKAYNIDLSDVSRVEVIPIAGTAAPTAIGMAVSATGTNIARNLAANNRLHALKRAGYRCAATAGTAAGARNAVALFIRGNTSTNGGFYFTQTFGLAEVGPAANSIFFAGLSATTGALSATTNASTLASMIGFGCNRANSTLSFMSNSATGPSNTVNLGGQFPVQNNAVYRMKLYAPPPDLDANVYWEIQRLDADYREAGIANNVALPANNIFLSSHLNITTGLAAQNVTVDLVRLYAELF